MRFCHYIYCGIPLSDGSADCPVCGHPPEAAQLLSVERLMAAVVEGLPDALVDMHQILPSHEGMLPAQLLAMERFGIEHALLQSAPEQAVSLCGDRQLAEVARQYPDRFWISNFVDPRQPDALEVVAGIAASGVKVVKLLPPAGFRLDDPAYDDFLGALEDLGLVAMIHTGFITARHKREEARAGVFMSSSFAEPLALDRPARRFPRLVMILCHLGGAMWFEQAAQMVSQHENVWGNVSGSGVFALERLLRNRGGVDWSKVFWGNDSLPFAYPLNLRLLQTVLKSAGAERLAPALLRDNGRRFADRFLA